MADNDLTINQLIYGPRSPHPRRPHDETAADIATLAARIDALELTVVQLKTRLAVLEPEQGRG